MEQVINLKDNPLFQKIAYPLASAVLMFLSFEYPTLWALAFLGLIPLISFLHRPKLSFKEAFAGSFVFGLLFMGGVIRWMWEAHPLTWAGVEETTSSFFMVAGGWLASTVVLGIFIGLWGGIYVLLRKKGDSAGRVVLNILLASSLWVVFEQFRALAFSIVVAGKNTLIGAHYTFGFLGYVLAENPFLLSLAGLGGLLLLSFFVVSLNFFVYEATTFHGKKKKEGSWLVAALFVFLTTFLLTSAILFYFPEKKEPHSIDVALISTNFEALFEWDQETYTKRQETIRNLLFDIKIRSQDPDVIVLPEASTFLDGLGLYEKNILLKSNLGLGDKEKLFVDSAFEEDGTTRRFNVLFYNTETGKRRISKELGTPIGEYAPYIVEMALKFFGEKGWADRYRETRFHERDGQLALGRVGKAEVGVLLCSEVFSANLHRRLVNEGADILINASSHSAFRGSKNLYNQTLKSSRVRAVENNRYFAQAGNDTPSFFINNKGEILSLSRPGEDGVLYDTVNTNVEDSLYSKAGDILFWITLLFSTAIAIVRKNKIKVVEK